MYDVEHEERVDGLADDLLVNKNYVLSLENAFDY